MCLSRRPARLSVAALCADGSTCVFHLTCSGFALKGALAECYEGEAVRSAGEEKSGVVYAVGALL